MAPDIHLLAAFPQLLAKQAAHLLAVHLHGVQERYPLWVVLNFIIQHICSSVKRAGTVHSQNGHRIVLVQHLYIPLIYFLWHGLAPGPCAQLGAARHNTS